MPSYISPPTSLQPGATVWAYLRDIGGPSQGESIERQRSEIQDYCTRHGLRLLHVFQDEARSGGSTAGREEFDQLIDASGKPDHPAGLLIWDFARFSRSLDDSGFYKATLRRNGLVVHSITDPVPEGVYGRLVELIIDVSNEETRRHIKRDVVSGLHKIVEQYDAMPGTPPIGYKRERINVGQNRDGTPHLLSRWVIDLEKAPLVRKAFEMRAEGATFPQIQKATHLFAGNNSYSTFFPNTIYKGQRYFGGKAYPCEAIVSPELWQKVQDLGELRDRSRYNPLARRNISSPYLLSGFLFCQECGAPLYGYEVYGRKKYYVCSRARRRKDCSARHIPSDQLEAGVIAKVLEDILTLENLLRIQINLQAEWNKFDAQRKLLQSADQRKLHGIMKKINNFRDALGENGKSRALQEGLFAAEQERDQLEYKLAHAPVAPGGIVFTSVTLAQIINELRHKLTSDDVTEKKFALRQIIERILVNRNDHEIRALIIYHLPEGNPNPPGQANGGFSNNECAPGGETSMLLIIPIKYKYHRADR